MLLFQVLLAVKASPEEKALQVNLIVEYEYFGYFPGKTGKGGENGEPGPAGEQGDQGGNGRAGQVYSYLLQFLSEWLA